MAKAKTTKKAEDKSSETEQVRHSIPTMGERRPAGGGSRLIDRHRQATKVTNKQVKDSERPVIDIPQSTQEKFIEFARTKEIFDLVEEEKKILQKDVSSEIYERFLDVLWASKCQPVNPSIKATDPTGKVDATGQFIVSAGSKIKINMIEPKDGESAEDALVRALINAGVSASNAERLVASEVSFAPQWTLNFTDMIRGEIVEGKVASPNPTQCEAAEILFCAIHGEDRDGNPVDDDQRLALLSSISSDGWISLESDIKKRTKYFPILSNSKDFLDRVCDYADSREELASVLSVFVPLYYPQRVVFAPSDSEASKKARMISEAKTIIG